MDPVDHWQRVHSEKHRDVSWWQERDALWLDLVLRSAPRRDARIIDVGAGASTLVDALLDEDFSDVTLLDISAAALERVRERLGDQSAVHLIAHDVRTFRDSTGFDLWHDRAVFHFLVEDEDRQAYAHTLAANVRAGGSVVIATFALDGPEQCSGLPVQRYDGDTLAGQFADAFTHEWTEQRVHVTPWDSTQSFTIVGLSRR